jgi:ABC-type sugar transport system substrate-binding protein
MPDITIRGPLSRAVIVVLTGFVLAFAAVACGGDDEGTGAPADTAPAETTETEAAETEMDDDAAEGEAEAREPVGGYVYVGTAADAEAARDAAMGDAQEPVEVPSDRTIGVIQLSGTSSQSIGVLETARQIADKFGWNVSVCDPNFDPQRIAQCATSIVAQNPAVIFSVSTNTGAMGSGYADAVARGIPWISVVSGVVPADGLYDYGADGFALSEIINQYLIEEMRNRNDAGPHKLFAIGAPTVGQASANSSEQLAQDVEAAGDVELINHDLDLSNAVQDTLNMSRRTLQQNPDLAGMWTLCDFCLPLMAQEVQQAQGSDRQTVVAGLFANPQAIEGIRNGTIDAVADLPWVSSVWIGMDQVLQNLTRDTPIASSEDVYGEYDLEFMRPYVIDQSNVGDYGANIPVFGPDYETYFTTKWAEEFGTD